MKKFTKVNDILASGFGLDVHYSISDNAYQAKPNAEHPTHVVKDGEPDVHDQCLKNDVITY